jgi:hypothetical protein
LVSGSSYVGGLVGNSSGGSITACFWDTQTSGISDGVGNVNPDPSGVTGKTTAEMMTLSTFTDPAVNWDFVATWAICEGTNYPRLQWQIPAGDWVCPDGVRVEDLAYFVQRWLLEDCVSSGNCNGVDLDESNKVDIADFAILAANWQKGVAAPIPPVVPVAYWAMNEVSGTFVSDSVGGHPGQTANMAGTPWVMGKVGNCLSFDGVDDCVSVAGYKGILGTSSRTCAAWIKTPGATQNTAILGWGGLHWIFGLFGTGELTVYANGPYIKTTRRVDDNLWHHVAAVMPDDGSPDVSEIKLYVDGLLQTTANSPGAINTPSANDVLIGAFSAGPPAGFFKGLIDDVRLYNMALSGAQIEEIFQTE